MIEIPKLTEKEKVRIDVRVRFERGGADYGNLLQRVEETRIFRFYAADPRNHEDWYLESETVKYTPATPFEEWVYDELHRIEGGAKSLVANLEQRIADSRFGRK